MQLDVVSVVVVQPGPASAPPPVVGMLEAPALVEPALPALTATALELDAAALPGQEVAVSGVHVKLSPQSVFVWHGKL